MDYAQDGDLSALSVEEIAELAGWGDDAAMFVNGLYQARFIDKHGDGYAIHDWSEYAGRLIDEREKKKEQDRERAKSYRERQQFRHASVTRDENERHASVTPVEKSREEYIGVEENKTTPLPPASGGGGAGGEPPKSKRPRKERAADSMPAKTKYAEFVSMTNDEYSSLVTKLGEAGAVRCVEILDNYKGQNGKKYASDYRAILNWVVKRYEEELVPGRGARGTPTTRSGQIINEIQGLDENGKLRGRGYFSDG